MQGLRDWAVTMKNLADASLLRNRMVALFEEAVFHTDDECAGSYSRSSQPVADFREPKQRERSMTSCATPCAITRS